MRKYPTSGELMEHEVKTEAHRLVLEWRGNGRAVPMNLTPVEDFAEWLIAGRPPAGDALRDLAARLTPNPALTVDGTLAVILDGIDRIGDEWLARALAHVNARQQGLDAVPLTDEQWKDGDLAAKIQLLTAARSLKAALREASKR